MAKKLPIEVIRLVKTTDYEPLVHFFENNVTPEVLRHFHPFPLSSDSARRIALTTHRDRYYVAVINSGEIAGLCMLRGWDEGYESPSFGVIVDQKYQKQGLGRSMTEFAIAEARRLNVERVRLSVNESNTHAKRLYESLGFKEISRESIIAGESEIKIVMVKELTS